MLQPRAHHHRHIDPHFHHQHINVSTPVYHPLSTLPLGLEDEQSSRCITSRAIGMLFILLLFLLNHNLHLDYGYHDDSDDDDGQSRLRPNRARQITSYTSRNRVMTWDERYSPTGGTVFSIPSTSSYVCARNSSIYISFWCEYLNGL
jgi:hypothetical protein